jgi:hypothetical protein
MLESFANVGSGNLSNHYELINSVNGVRRRTAGHATCRMHARYSVAAYLRIPTPASLTVICTNEVFPSVLCDKFLGLAE